MTQQQKNKAAEGVSTALTILDTLVSNTDRSWGVRELAEHLQMSRTTANRVLVQMCHEGLASQAVDSSYTVGPRLGVLSSTLYRLHPILSRGNEILDAIRHRTGGTVFMSVQAVDGQSCFVVQESESETAVRYRIEPGNILPTYAGAAGQAILSQLDEALWPDQVRAFTDRTVISSKERLDLLRAVRRKKFAVSIGQHIKGAAGVAVPFRFSPALFGSVSVSRPDWEFKEEQVANVVSELKAQLSLIESEANNCFQRAVDEELVIRSDVVRAGSQVERVNQLLTFLASHPCHPLTLADIGLIVGAGNYAISSLVEAAEQHGVICRCQDGNLFIGPTLLRWLASVDSSLAPEALALGELRELSTLTGETVGLALLLQDPRQLRMVKSVPGKGRIQYVLDAPVSIPLHLGAAGKAVLAFAPEWLDEIDIHNDAQGRKVKVTELRKVLAEIRANGFATAEGERIPEAFGVAAPVFVNGKIAGSLTVTTPRYRVDRSRIPEVAEQVKKAASNLSRLLSII